MAVTGAIAELQGKPCTVLEIKKKFELLKTWTVFRRAGRFIQQNA